MLLAGSTDPELKMNPDVVAKFKYAPITSVDVDRSFSDYKNILSDRRQNFTKKHLNQHSVIACF